MGKKSYYKSHTDMLTANVSSICCFSEISGNSTTYTRFTANQKRVYTLILICFCFLHVFVSRFLIVEPR